MNRIELVLVLLFTFFVIVVWITSDVILVKPNTPEDPKIQSMLEPLTPTFDSKAIELINSTKLEQPVREVQVPTPIPQPTPQLSPSPSPRTPLASSSPIGT